MGQHVRRYNAVESAAEILGDLPPFAFAGSLDAVGRCTLTPPDP
jgi:hypothetical protein